MRILVPAALLLALAAGCANNTEPPLSPGDAPSATAATSATAAPGETVLTGTVTAGVEPNCLLLKDGTGDHLLIVKDEKARASLQVGTEVTVAGKPAPGMMTTCMQGEPFEVSSVR